MFPRFIAPKTRSRTPAAALAAALLVAVLAAALGPAPGRGRSPGLASAVLGAGEPTLVLIHGIGQDRSVWNRVLPRLEARHRVVLVDLPGHGASATISPLTTRSIAETLDRTLKEKQIKRALLVGHSYGGLVALQEAVDEPDRALGVVSIDLATYTEADSERIANLDQLITQRFPLFVRGVFEGMTRDSSMVDSVIAKAESVPREVMRDYFRDVWKTDLRPRIKKVKKPVLVVLTDTSWPSAESWTNAKRRFGYETAGPVVGSRIWGSAHLVPIDQPDSLASAILDFAATLPR